MTGPEHYRMAEELLRLIEGTPEDSVGSVAADAAKAQAHATLALAAATALGGGEGPPAPDWDAWYRTASEGPVEKRRRAAADAAENAEFATEDQS